IIGSYDLQFQDHEAEDLSTAKFGNGVIFDGSGEHLLRNSSGSLLSTSYTLSVWAKLNTVSLQDIFVADQHGVLFEVQADSRLRFLHRSPPGSKPDDNVFTGNEIKANEWMHLVAVRDSEAASQETTREPMGDRDFNIVIGRLSVNRAERAFNGQLDDLRIYKSALSTELVGKIYGDGEGDLDHGPIVTLNGDGFLRVETGTAWDDPGANATDAEDGNLTDSIVTTYESPTLTDPRAPMARWSFNGDTKDLSGNANDATLVGDTAFVDAKFGQGIEMDNEGDYAEVVAISGASNTSTLSVSAWIKIKSFGTGSSGDGGILTTSISSNPLLLWVNYDAAGNNNPSLSFNMGNAVL
ncbi:MAG: LamG-like jellyroll fold domain-containing protein, partial [Opitutae bacterium]